MEVTLGPTNSYCLQIAVGNFLQKYRAWVATIEREREIPYSWTGTQSFNKRPVHSGQDIEIRKNDGCLQIFERAERRFKGHSRIAEQRGLERMGLSSESQDKNVVYQWSRDTESRFAHQEDLPRRVRAPGYDVGHFLLLSYLQRLACIALETIFPRRTGTRSNYHASGLSPYFLPVQSSGESIKEQGLRDKFGTSGGTGRAGGAASPRPSSASGRATTGTPPGDVIKASYRSGSARCRACRPLPQDQGASAPGADGLIAVVIAVPTAVANVPDQ
ncbi:hypothetical protein B0H17DRAFT_1140443 [Mycena rosella]|uniref:Uncharacterized protein n=1 Tax=Mycena rosella TaxID=1033263 RepID=A0AAD7GA36_MYCRO|nr:hypothetical protein B0H17DRAFT_1140443 [Mycena rosella]